MDSNNPYEAPAAAVVDVGADTSRPLFRTSGIYVATFLGSALAGGWVLAMNHAALGQFDLARKVRWSGLAGMVVVVLLSMLLPEQVPGIVYLIPQMLAVSYWMKHTQGDAIAARVSAGLPMRSNWLAAGVGALAALALLAVLLVLVAIAIYGFGLEMS
ncbi:hypothetical protein [Lysobacter sp. TAB13]|uniref:hypothetical protein n=1 Tax=Lysobacter sp. TAB13 TaxID=3233065 RepID=UPI003F98F4DC